jgi:hypothetical protein
MGSEGCESMRVVAAQRPNRPLLFLRCAKQAPYRVAGFSMALSIVLLETRRRNRDAGGGHGVIHFTRRFDHGWENIDYQVTLGHAQVLHALVHQAS